MSKKPYLQCLLDQPKILSLTLFLPSDESQAFYTCILAGHAEHPGWGAQHYQMVLRDAEVNADNDETDAPMAALADFDEDGIVVSAGGALIPAPAKKAAATKPVASAMKACLSLLAGSVPVAEAPEPPVLVAGAAPSGAASSSGDVIVASGASQLVVQEALLALHPWLLMKMQ